MSAAATQARLERRGGVAVLSFSHAPVNTLAQPMRAAVCAELERALADASIEALVVTGEGRGFCAGAQITEFNTPLISAAPTAHDLWARIEASPKPVVAAIHRYAFGGGLEFALVCHARVATPDTLLAAPEVTLGLLPGAGGTQRLPRALGVERALEMMLSGERVRAGQAPQRLVTALSGDPVARAVEIAGELAAKEGPLPRLRDLDACIANPLVFSSARERVAAEAPGRSAPPAIIDCVEAAVTMDFEEGLRFEREKFQGLVNNEESKALRRRFLEERHGRSSR